MEFPEKIYQFLSPFNNAMSFIFHAQIYVGSVLLLRCEGVTEQFLLSWSTGNEAILSCLICHAGCSSRFRVHHIVLYRKYCKIVIFACRKHLQIVQKFHAHEYSKHPELSKISINIVAIHLVIYCRLLKGLVRI